MPFFWCDKFSRSSELRYARFYNVLKRFERDWRIYSKCLDHLYLKGRATYLQRSSLSKLTKPKCSWLRVNTTKYLKFIAITFVFQNNAPFSRKTTNDDFRFVATTPQTNLRFFVYLVWLSSFSFFTLFLQMCWMDSYFKGT